MKKIIKRKSLRIFIYIVLILSITLTIMQIIPPKKIIEDNPFIINKGDDVLIAAHRGGKDLNPENTFLAFDFVYEEYGVDILELDLVLTKDKHLVAIHDDTINRTSDAPEILGVSEALYVRDFTLDELRNFNFGYKFKAKDGSFPYKDLVSFTDIQRKEVIKDSKLNIVTIDEIFERYKDTDLMYIVEIKDSANDGLFAADHLYDLLVEYNLLEKVIVGTFHDEVSNYLRTEYSEVLTGGAVMDVAKFVLTQMVGLNLFNKDRFENMQIPTSYKIGPVNIKLAKKTYINRAHRRGISVQFWTINDKEEMRKLILLGADVIMTDSPDVLYELIEEMKNE